ncbi:MAG: SET domain-containing protein-lysine N-methyltransferase, partial [Sphingomonadaceae bacterium]
MGVQYWWYAAIVCNIAAYIFYYLGIRRQLVRPNRSSWLIWSAATAIEAMTYQAVNHGAAQNIIFTISALACILVTLAVWRQSAWQPPTRTESLCMGLSLAALVIWGVFQSAFWAHMLVVAAIPVSFIPTWASAIADREHERSPAWGLWTVGDLATLLVIVAGLQDERAEIPYIFVELVCHASMWFIIGLATINPWRSFGFARGNFFIREVDRGVPKIFAIGENHLGKAVFAAVPFAAGDRVVEFKGARVHKSQLPQRVEGQADRFVQIDADHYMG